MNISFTLLKSRKTECNDGFIWIQKITNKRGSFIEITKVHSSGGKRNLVKRDPQKERKVLLAPFTEEEQGFHPIEVDLKAVRRFKWDKSLVITIRDFRDDWEESWKP